MSGDDDTELLLKRVAAAPPIRPPSSFRGTDRFAVVRPLGEGSFGIVCEVNDRQSGDRVALKLLRRPRADWLLRFKREFRALADFSHANVVPLYELGSVGDDWFFTMKLVEGEPFLAHVRRGLDRIAPALAQLARGLSALHAAGIVHRDVKPSNVLVAPDGRVTLLDFGLAVEVAEAETSAIAGTPLYMAPEQSAGGTTTPAADGVMLYEALTGQPPFAGSVPELLTNKLAHDPPRASAIAPSTPTALDELCHALLARDPERRAGAVAVLGAVAPTTVSTVPARSDPWVGRRAELAQLHEAFASRSRGRPALALVRGASGIGKSALLRRFLDETRRRHPDALVLAARCFERETIPFKAFDGIVDALARALRGDAHAAELLPRDVAALTRLFPVLAQSDALAHAATRAPTSDGPAAWRARGSDAFRELVGRIADRRPLVLVVDDLQWGDADSARLLGDLLRGAGAPSLLFVGAARAGEEASPVLRQLAELRAAPSFSSFVDAFDVQLDPLDDDDARRLLIELLPGARATLDAMIAEAGGSPFFLAELARQAGEERGVARLDDVVRRRYAALSPAARGLLETAAVAARPVTAEILHGAAGGGDLAAVTAELRGAHLLRAREDEGELRLEVYHDRIREAVVAALDGERRATLHRRLADAYAARGDHERVAIHLRESGDKRRAAELTVLAARRAETATAFDQAARLYREGLTLHREAGGLPVDEERALERALAESLSSSGRCAEAADAFLAAAAHAEGRAAIELRRRAVEDLLQGGHLARGREIASSLLASLGLRVPRSPAGVITVGMWLTARLKLRGGLRRPLRMPAKVPVDAWLCAETLWAMLSGLSLIEPMLNVILWPRFSLLALDIGDPFQVTRALTMEAIGIASLRSDRDRGLARQSIERAQALASECDRPDAEVGVALARGMVDLLNGRFAPAVRHFDEAEDLAQRLGVHRGIESTWPALMRSTCHYWMGHVASQMADLPRRVRHAEERGNLLTWTMLYSHYAVHAALFPSGVEESATITNEVNARWQGLGVVMQSYWLMVNEVQLALVSADGASAWRAVTRVWPALERQQVLATVHNRIDAEWVRGRAALGAAARGGSDQRRLLAEVERSARRIMAASSVWGRGFSASLRGGAAMVAGDRERAARWLAEAEPLVDALDIETLLAAIRVTRGRLIGGHAGESLLRLADAWRVSQGLPTLDNVCRAYLPEGTNVGRL